MKNGWLIYDREGRERNGWFIEQLLSYSAERHENLRLIEAEKLLFGVKNGRLFVDFGGEKPDYALVRCIFPLLSQCLEACGVRVFNNAGTSLAANDKRRTQALAAKLRIPTPDTYFLDARRFDPAAFSYPLILKSADGHGGKEVFYVENPKSASLAVESFKTRDFLLQECVDKGRDVRVYLLGEKILCAVERRSENDFRSNFSLGGGCALFEPSSEMVRAVGKISRRLRPTFIGVDFIFRDGQPLLNEIEDVVGTRMIYKLTDLPVHRLYFDKVIEALNQTV